MPSRLTWQEVQKIYPDEWVAFVDYVASSPSAPTGIDGVVVAHHPERGEFHAMVKTLFPRYGDLALRFTGPRVKNPEIPLLWQITRTDSMGD